MVKPPPTAIRYLVLVAAISLLGLAVCTKTKQAQTPQQQATPIVQEDTMSGGEDSAEQISDAGLEPPAIQAPNPPANAVDKGNEPVQEEFFPATKSGGMF